MTRRPQARPLHFPLGAALFLLAGCASWAKHGAALIPPRKLRIAVVPVVNGVRIKKLKTIQSLSASKIPPPDETELIHRKMQEATDRMTRLFESQLKSSYFFEAASSEEVRQALAQMSLAASTAALTSDQIEQIGKRLNAPTLLTLRLVGYGKIKTSWLVWLLGSGAAEGLAQGIAASVLIHNTWAAVGIGAEEFLQESVEWLGGIYLFDKWFTPVILEARLLSAKDGAVLWEKTAVATLPRKALKRLPKAERHKKEVRLRLTSERVIEKLVRSLEKKATKNQSPPVSE